MLRLNDEAGAERGLTGRQRGCGGCGKSFVFLLLLKAKDGCRMTPYHVEKGIATGLFNLPPTLNPGPRGYAYPLA